MFKTWLQPCPQHILQKINITFIDSDSKEWKMGHCSDQAYTHDVHTSIIVLCVLSHFQ